MFYCKGGGPRSWSGRLGDKKNLSLLLVIHGTCSIIPSHYIDCGNPVSYLSVCHLRWSNLSESAIYCPQKCLF